MMKQIEMLKTELDARRMSKKTIINYIHPCTLFMEWHNGKNITENSVAEYSAKLRNSGLATATMKLHSCSIRFFIRNVLKKERLASKIPPIRQESKLPIVLSKKEIKGIIDSTKNPIHKTILIVLYTCGLRLSELINIKMGEVDFDRKNIIVHGKGSSDRFIPISDSLIYEIKSSLSHLKHSNYLCSTQKGKRQLSVRSIQKLIENGAIKAGITKRVYPHLFRHSRATHLLEDGVDIRYIQLLLGHTSILSTAQYTHVAQMPNERVEKNTDFLYGTTS